MEFTRGDTFIFKFKRKDANNADILTKASKMWFTVKKNNNSQEVLIQKTLENGISFTSDGYYHIEIKPSDTSDLKYITYVCDIQVENAGAIKTIYKGTIKLTEEVTFESGE